MPNQVMLIGRVVRDVEVKELESGNKVGYITLAVNRRFKNADGVYEIDFIECKLLSYVAQNAADYIRKGDLIGVNGRLQSSIITDDSNTIDETKKYKLEVVVERITYLSSRKGEECYYDRD